MATVTAFFVAGVVGTYLGWRYAFGLVIPFSVRSFLMSLRLNPVAKLPGVMERTTATPDQVAEIMRINADARLRALKLSFLLLAIVALMVIVPSGHLPGLQARRSAGRSGGLGGFR